MDILVRILAIVVPCLMLGVGALTGWIWMLWQDHNKHKLYVAENMLKQGALQEVKEEIHSLRDVIYRSPPRWMYLCSRSPTGNECQR